MQNAGMLPSPPPARAVQPAHASPCLLARLDRVWMVHAVSAVLLFVSLVVFLSLHRPQQTFAAAPDGAGADQPADYAVLGAADLGSGATTGSAARPTSAATTGTGANGFPMSSLAADGIPQTALEAYEQAAQWEGGLDPSCGITWPLLAAIGRVESDHGRFAGAVLHTDGTSTPRIIGIPLNGHGTALILDTDHGRLDGDTVYDHAVGPMQFIPSTWAEYGVDATHSGSADPFNIFDAAAAAARYLCAASSLDTVAGQTRAVLAYNHSDAYVAMVLELERSYAAGAGMVVPVTAGPVPSPGAGSLPPPDLPPVDPAPPPAAGPSATPTEPASEPTSTTPPSASSGPGDSSSSGSLPPSSSGPDASSAPGTSDPPAPSDATTDSGVGAPSTTPGPVVTPSGDPPPSS